jgi:hypothetical protein
MAGERTKSAGSRFERAAARQGRPDHDLAGCYIVLFIPSLVRVNIVVVVVVVVVAAAAAGGDVAGGGVESVLEQCRANAYYFNVGLSLLSPYPAVAQAFENGQNA